MPMTDAQKAANERYRKANVTQKTIRFYPAEADILAWAQEQPNFAGYVKDLIRADMEARRVRCDHGWSERAGNAHERTHGAPATRWHMWLGMIMHNFLYTSKRETMEAVTYSSFRRNMKAHMRAALDDAETILVTNNDPSENVVVMSQRDYENLMETVRIYENSYLREKLMRGIERVGSGDVSVHELSEDADE